MQHNNYSGAINNESCTAVIVHDKMHMMHLIQNRFAQSGWYDFFVKIQSKPEFLHLLVELEKEYASKIIFPEKNSIFRAFDLCDLDDVKIVILGQDPYHGTQQADGLAFSLNEKSVNAKIPPSLKNINKEIHDNFCTHEKIETLKNCKSYLEHQTDLSFLAMQGVLLLNAYLTVRAGAPMSHSKIGWNFFTDEVIAFVSKRKQSIVFILWGKFAQSKEHLIDAKKHLILKSPHPSPFSAYNGFFGNNHFKKANEFLAKNQIEKVQWI